jgi:hypothetical protein
MPKLLIFAPCEKVIIDQNNVLSIITVLQELKIELPEPPRAIDGKTPVIAMKWDVVALWAKTNDDAPETVYQTRLGFIDPTGVALEGFAAGAVEFSFADKSHHRIVTTILGFPIQHEGRYLVRLWLHKKGDAEGDPVAEFPIMLHRSKPKD